MLIGIDASRAVIARRTGTETYSLHLIRALLKLGIGHRFRLYTKGVPPAGLFWDGAALAGVDRVVMMLVSPSLRVVPATIHIPLAQVPAALSAGTLDAVIRITHGALINDFGIAAPRLAVAGLNPHAGEGGRIGREEIEVITPVLARLRAEGMDIRGPLAADTMFHAAARATCDAAIAMYHDQALIPIKTLDFDRGVNVTLGLPFVRTSPDHGTAFDIAGSGRARPDSLIEALRLAARMAAMRAAR